MALDQWLTDNVGSVAGWAADTVYGNQKDPGFFGTGYRRPNAVGVDQAAAQIPGYGEDRSRSLSGALAAQARAAPTAQYAQLDGSMQGQARGGQMDLARMLMQQAQGQGPSVAGAQLQRATDQNIAQAAALAQSQRGQNAGLAQRQLAMNQAGMAQQAAQDSGLLRLQEQQASQNQLGQVLAGMRGQDIGYASENAGLQQQANLANQQAALQQMGLNDALRQFYERQATGLGLAQGQQNMNMAQLQAQVGLGNEQLANSAYSDAANRRTGQSQFIINKWEDMLKSMGSGIETLVGALSDERAKTDVVRLPVDAIPGVPWATWRYLPAFDPTGAVHVGVIAQDLEKVAPQYVSRRPDGLRQVDYRFLVAGR